MHKIYTERIRCYQVGAILLLLVTGPKRLYEQQACARIDLLMGP